MTFGLTPTPLWPLADVGVALLIRLPVLRFVRLLIHAYFGYVTVWLLDRPSREASFHCSKWMRVSSMHLLLTSHPPCPWFLKLHSILCSVISSVEHCSLRCGLVVLMHKRRSVDNVFLHLAIVAQETQEIPQLASALAASRQLPSRSSSVFSVECADEIMGAASLTSILWRLRRN